MTLFDHLNNITQKKPKWDSLSDEDKKSWNNFMVHRYVSMDHNFIHLTNLVQKYSTLSSKQLYIFYSSIIPKGKYYFKYVKKSKKEKYNKDLLQILSSHFKCSTREVKDYLKILDKEEIISILQNRGLDKKQIKKLLK